MAKENKSIISEVIRDDIQREIDNLHSEILERKKSLGLHNRSIDAIRIDAETIVKNALIILGLQKAHDITHHYYYD